MVLELLHLIQGTFVILLDDADEVGEVDETHVGLTGGAPHGAGLHSGLQHRIEGFPQREAGVENDKLGGGWYEIVALVAFEKVEDVIVNTRAMGGGTLQWLDDWEPSVRIFEKDCCGEGT